MQRVKQSGGRRAMAPPALARKGLAAAATVAMVAGLVVIGAGVANAVVPTFPDNVVVFPDRDFVTIEGYQDHVGEEATVEVLRDKTVVGSAVGTIEAGDVAFEINHPGGYCWGAGTDLKVTPNILAGDVVRITFANGVSEETVTSGAAVTGRSELTGSTLIVKGKFDGGIPAQMEQRIISPDLTDTSVGRRDIRAVFGPMTPAPKGGYSSSLTLDDTNSTFTATYEFDEAATAAIAAKATGERAMYWQVEDADANRQGLTIAEFGELGGPGMGGCPAGPADQAPPQGTYSAVRSIDKTKIGVTWTEPTAAPDTAAVTGYSIEAIDAADRVVGVRVAVGTSTTLQGLDSSLDYRIEVRSLAGTKLSDVYPGKQSQAVSTAPRDTTAPKLTASPTSGPDQAVETDTVTLSSEAGADIYYTVDGTPANSGDLPSDSAKLYNGPVKIMQQDTELRAVAYDAAGNLDTYIGLYSPVSQPAPLEAPTLDKATAGAGSVRLDWTQVTGATDYQVAVSPVPPGGQPAGTTARTQTVSGLTGGTEYSFTVTAQDGARVSPASNAMTATPSVVQRKVAITLGRWKARDLRIQGTTDADPGAGTIRFFAYANGAVTQREVPSANAGAQALTAAVAPATGSTFAARYRNAAAGTANPGTIVAVLSDSAGNVLGVSAPFTVTNG